MSTLEASRRRLEAAVERLESALRGRSSAKGRGNGDAGLDRDVELLRVECDSLRRALEVEQGRNKRLADAADHVAARLDRTIGELADMAEG